MVRRRREASVRALTNHPWMTWQPSLPQNHVLKGSTEHWLKVELELVSSCFGVTSGIVGKQRSAVVPSGTRRWCCHHCGGFWQCLMQLIAFFSTTVVAQFKLVSGNNRRKAETGRTRQHCGFIDTECVNLTSCLQSTVHTCLLLIIYGAWWRGESVNSDCGAADVFNPSRTSKHSTSESPTIRVLSYQII